MRYSLLPPNDVVHCHLVCIVWVQASWGADAGDATVSSRVLCHAPIMHPGPASGLFACCWRLHQNAALSTLPRAQQADEARRQLQRAEAELRDVRAAAAAGEEREAELAQQLAAAQAAAGSAAINDAAAVDPVPATPAAPPSKEPGAVAAAASANGTDQVCGC
jgi:hypothetical protein